MLRLYVLLTLGFVLLLISPQGAIADKEMFINLKCNKCHGISAIGIEKKKAAADDAEEEAEEEGDKVEPPDLSDTGLNHDAAFFKDFLMKKVGHKAHGDATSAAKHKIKFKGSAEDLDKLVQWLLTLKQPAAVK